ncbi:MAG: amidohydrolase family protein [Acidimicrobiales bacterium]
MMTTNVNDLGFRPFDADNHYYEAPDAFTRHLEPQLAKRCMQWAEIDNRTRLLVGGTINRFLPNATFDPIARPGALYDYYRGKAGADLRTAFGDLDALADRPEYQNRDARIEVMKEQGLDGAILLPTLAMGMEESLKHDPEAVTAAFRAFNRWIAEDWGFHNDGLLYGAPYITLANPDSALTEIEFAAEHGAKVVCMRAAPPPTNGPSRSPGDPVYDRFWATAAEAGIVVAYHSGDVGTAFFAERWGDQAAHQAFSMTPLYSAVTVDRAVFDVLAVLTCHGVFGRHPTLKVATIESGSEWLPLLFSKMEKVYKRNADSFTEHPHDTFRERLWVSPHFEDDKRAVADLLGVEHVLMGSDWPHAEGLAHPLDYSGELERDGFSEEEVRLVMRDNALAMLAG